jgi:hypothetical protein
MWMELRRVGGTRAGRLVLGTVAVVGTGWLLMRLVMPAFLDQYTGGKNGPLTFDSSVTVSEREFEALADELTGKLRRARAEQVTAHEEDPFSRRIKTETLMRTRSFQSGHQFAHIDYFRKAGIRRYEGPSTCLTCHASMKVARPDGTFKDVSTMHDVLGTVHFTFQQTATGMTTFGYDGRQVNAPRQRPLPIGKIDRACGIPGSFSWTGWAALVESKPGGADGESVTRSEGCGQCHIGGNYQPATEAMLPGISTPKGAQEGIDCLICHSRTYDINQRYVIDDGKGLRWNQDRSLQAAMTVGQPGVDNCLLCHQHNMGGDTFAGNVAAKNLGHRNQRLLHKGAKRGTPFDAENDLHAAAGIHCLDCHVPEGHRIPRGTRGTDLVANDLPGREVSCEQCHTAAPHTKGEDRALLNGHSDRIACETCHIKELMPESVVLRDWVNPVWHEEEGIYTYRDIYHSGKAGKGFMFLWFNGNGTFLANALGDYPGGGKRYNPLMNQLVKIDDPEIVAEVRRHAEAIRDQHAAKGLEFDVERYVREAVEPLSTFTPEMVEKRRLWIEEKIRPLMAQGKSKIYPFRVFNAMMYEDLSNQGPFGAMILPFDYPRYYRDGDPAASVRQALRHPIVRRMYQQPFKWYMMDEFMKYFGVDKWSAVYPLREDGGDGTLQNVEPRWMRQMGTLMINHSIQRQGRGCVRCHSKTGILDFEQLGYPPERIEVLQRLPELQ